MEEESRERCPNCGSSNIAKIIWGLPEFTEELQKKSMPEKSSWAAVFPARATLNAMNAD